MKIIIIILQAILNLVRKRRDLIANINKIPAEIKKRIQREVIVNKLVEFYTGKIDELAN